MRAVIFEEFGGPLRVQNVPDPAPRPDGVVLAVRSTGICRSDWHGWQGHDPDVRVPHVPGHELAGEVVAVGASVRGLAIGDRVTVPFVSGCGACAPCHRGDPQVCDAQFQPGFTHWGSFAEYVGLHYAERNVVKLPESFSYERAASLGCRFTTAYRALVQLAALGAGESLAVFGCGGVGLCSILIARALGARAIAVDIDARKLELARQVGAELCIDASRAADVPAQVVEATRGGADVGIDALGSSLTLRQSLESLRKRGRHVQVGLMVGERTPPAVPMGRVISNELVLYGSHGIAAAAYPDVFDLIERRNIPLDAILGPRLGLADVPTELPRMAEFRGLGIALVDPGRL
ncbi:MAG TPA: zinc-dependent alcohol dehydrogenase family protein [Polyangiaceae bacterium]|nr:zinc-dependent alcohol dehydrogenase family protein [Polyangiaceae bacterium]